MQLNAELALDSDCILPPLALLRRADVTVATSAKFGRDLGDYTAAAAAVSATERADECAACGDVMRLRCTDYCFNRAS